MKIKNLTPHLVVIVHEGGRREIPASGTTARLRRVYLDRLQAEHDAANRKAQAAADAAAFAVSHPQSGRVTAPAPAVPGPFNNPFAALSGANF